MADLSLIENSVSDSRVISLPYTEYSRHSPKNHPGSDTLFSCVLLIEDKEHLDFECVSRAIVVDQVECCEKASHRSKLGGSSASNRLRLIIERHRRSCSPLSTCPGLSFC